MERKPSPYKHPDLLPKIKAGPFKTSKESGVPSIARGMYVDQLKEGPQEQECASLLWPSHTCLEPAFPLGT